MTVLIGSIDKNDIDDAVVKTAAALRGYTIDEARADRRRYAAFHSDEGFSQNYLPLIDWETLTLPKDLRQDSPFWERVDFDIGRSTVYEPNWEDTADPSVRPFLMERQWTVSGRELRTLRREGRAPTMGEYTVFSGCIQARSASLLDVVRAVLNLEHPECALLVPNRRPESNERHRAFFETLPAAVRDHVSLFFWAPDDGACLRDREPHWPSSVVACWMTPEATASCWLYEIENDDVPRGI